MSDLSRPWRPRAASVDADSILEESHFHLRLVIHVSADWNPWDRKIDGVLSKFLPRLGRAVSLRSMNADDPANFDFMAEKSVTPLPTLLLYEKGRYAGLLTSRLPAILRDSFFRLAESSSRETTSPAGRYRLRRGPFPSENTNCATFLDGSGLHAQNC